MLQFLKWESLQSHRFNMHLCIIYKAYFNLVMFPLLDIATPATVQTQDSNIKFIPPHCSKDVFTHSYQLHSRIGMPSRSWQCWLHPWNCSRPASQELHANVAPNCFYPVLSACFCSVY